MSFLRWLRHRQILTQLFAHTVRKNQVRIPRPKVGERLAQRDILQTQGVGILAAGEYPSAVNRLGAFRVGCGTNETRLRRCLK